MLRVFKKFVFATLALATLAAPAARAGHFEISAGFAFNQSNYGNSNYSWTRRWGASFGYHFLERSEIEFSFQDVVDRNHIVSYEDTTFHDRIYSINWLQSFLPKDFILDPYLKLGVGQLNRDASGTYAFGTSPYSQVDSLTVLLGAGLRVRITPRFGLRGELSSYLNGGSLRTLQDNVSLSCGFSVYF